MPGETWRAAAWLLNVHSVLLQRRYQAGADILELATAASMQPCIFMRELLKALPLQLQSSPKASTVPCLGLWLAPTLCSHRLTAFTASPGLLFRPLHHKQLSMVSAVRCLLGCSCCQSSCSSLHAAMCTAQSEAA